MRTAIHLMLSLLFCLTSATPSRAEISGGGGDDPSKQRIPVTSTQAPFESQERSGLKNVGNGLLMAGQFTYLFSGGVAYITLDHIQNNSSTRTTGTLQLTLWATTYQPPRGGSVTGYRLANFPKLAALAPQMQYSNITQSAGYAAPPDGTYWLALVLGEFDPAACPGNADGYCAEDVFSSYTQASYTSALPSYTFTDIWYNPTESGWGLSITHHSSNAAFIAWYTYDEFGKPKWYYMSNCPMVGNSCSGPVYETTGPAFGPTFDSSRVTSTAVGTMTLSFSAYGTAVMSYYVKGVSAVKTIQRLGF